MKLAVDIGNTTTTVGVVKANNLGPIHKFSTERYENFDDLWRDWQEHLGREILPAQTDLFLASVVPDLTEVIKNYSSQLRCLRVLEYPWEDSPLEVAVESPETVGGDRIAVASAFYAEYGAGIVVDFGTATTAEAVLPAGEYAGGVIMPGVEATFAGLFDKTAALPQIVPAPPETFKCDTTENSLQSGIYYGLTGAVERSVAELRKKFALSEDCSVVATGGRGGEFMRFTDTLTAYDEQLVLKGLLLCCSGQNF